MVIKPLMLPLLLLMLHLLPLLKLHLLPAKLLHLLLRLLHLLLRLLHLLPANNFVKHHSQKGALRRSFLF